MDRITKTYGMIHQPLIAKVEASRRQDGGVVAFIREQLCFFERGTPQPKAGDSVEVMITRPVHPYAEEHGWKYIDSSRLTGLNVQVVDRSRHQLVAIDGFTCSGSMCSTTAVGAPTDGHRPLTWHDLYRDSGNRPIALRDTFTITPGRTRILEIDNVNARYGEWREGTPTNVWVEVDPRTMLALRQPRGGCVRVAGLTRMEDLDCARLIHDRMQEPRSSYKKRAA